LEVIQLPKFEAEKQTAIECEYTEPGLLEKIVSLPYPDCSQRIKLYVAVLKKLGLAQHIKLGMEAA